MEVIDMNTVSSAPSPASGHGLALASRDSRRGRTFEGICDCGARSGELLTAGMAHAWHGDHQDAAGARPPAFLDRPERCSYEAAVARTNPRLVPLLAGGLDDFRAVRHG
jgi:hypothetical protein